ncbi:MAG TPA: NYN domain-containing protein [Candidatus Methylomirabilis sp.]|nr:NYN domain-containing protein [Candidatus Methylomirabilis sp.]
MRTIVYIDGFNLYYAIRSSGCKWLNLKALSQAVLSSHHFVIRLKYYTARVSGSVDPDQPRRQQIYLTALRTLPELEIHFGTFLAKNVWRPVMNLPVADRNIENAGHLVSLEAGDHRVHADPATPGGRVEVLSVGKYGSPANPGGARTAGPGPVAVRAQVHWMEEKGSDVSLACHLVNDAWAGRFEAAAVLSNDTDLVEPIRIVTQELRKPVILLCASPRGASQPLRSVATSVRHIHRPHLLASRFPDQLPGTSIRKPGSW